MTYKSLKNTALLLALCAIAAQADSCPSNSGAAIDLGVGMIIDNSQTKGLFDGTPSNINLQGTINPATVRAHSVTATELNELKALIQGRPVQGVAGQQGYVAEITQVNAQNALTHLIDPQNFDEASVNLENLEYAIRSLSAKKSAIEALAVNQRNGDNSEANLKLINETFAKVGTERIETVLGRSRSSDFHKAMVNLNGGQLLQTTPRHIKFVTQGMAADKYEEFTKKNSQVLASEDNKKLINKIIDDNNNFNGNEKAAAKKAVEASLKDVKANTLKATFTPTTDGSSKKNDGKSTFGMQIGLSYRHVFSPECANSLFVSPRISYTFIFGGKKTLDTSVYSSTDKKTYTFDSKKELTMKPNGRFALEFDVGHRMGKLSLFGTIGCGWTSFKFSGSLNEDLKLKSHTKAALILGGGLSYDITKNIIFGIRYSAHLLGKTTFKSQSTDANYKNVSFERKGAQHSVMATLSYRFGQN